MKMLSTQQNLCNTPADILVSRGTAFEFGPVFVPAFADKILS
jgi:hypothetical protein